MKLALVFATLLASHLNAVPMEPEASSEAKGVEGAGSTIGGALVFFVDLIADKEAAVKPKSVMVFSSNIVSLGFAVADLATWGGIIGGAIIGLSHVLFPSQQLPNADNVYQTLYGRIESQINKAINTKGTAQLVQRLNSLTHSLNDQMTAYMADMDLLGNDVDHLRTQVAARGGSISIAPYQVDSSMSAINLALSSSLDWYGKPQYDPRHPTAWVFANAPGLGAQRCLRTKDSNLQDGTDLIVDDQCELASLDDKMFTIGENYQAVMLTNMGTKCLAYNSDDGNDLSRHIAIFDVNSPQCKSSQHPITFKLTQRGNYALYDGVHMLCVGNGESSGDRNVIVTIQVNDCLNNDNLEFVSRIPINVNKPGTGGSTGNSLTPSKTFDEVGVQVFYFPTLASAHLTSLKEMYQFGSLKGSARSQFYQKVDEYKAWLDVFVPMFTEYSAFARINSTYQLAQARSFRSVLDRANISSRMTVQLGQPFTRS